MRRFCQRVFQSNWINLYSCRQCVRVPVASHPPQYLIFVSLSNFRHSDDCINHLVVVSACIFLMQNDTVDFMFLDHLLILFLKCLFGFLLLFLTCFGFWFIGESSSYVLTMSSSSDMCIIKIFYEIVDHQIYTTVNYFHPIRHIDCFSSWL